MQLARCYTNTLDTISKSLGSQVLRNMTFAANAQMQQHYRGLFHQAEDRPLIDSCSSFASLFCLVFLTGTRTARFPLPPPED